MFTRLFVMVMLPEADVCSRLYPFKSSLSFRNLISRSCSTYFDKETTFSLLKISFSSSVSHESMTDFIVSFNCNRVFWYIGQVARKCCSSSIIG